MEYFDVIWEDNTEIIKTQESIAYHNSKYVERRLLAIDRAKEKQFASRILDKEGQIGVVGDYAVRKQRVMSLVNIECRQINRPKGDDGPATVGSFGHQTSVKWLRECWRVVVYIVQLHDHLNLTALSSLLTRKAVQRPYQSSRRWAAACRFNN